MEVIILAGGLGTRLRGVIGNETPKCMAPVAGKPFLWYLLKYLSGYNVTRVILSVGHLREVIYQWIDEVKEEFPFEFDYAVEETPLGTGGGIRLAMQKVKEDKAIILNGDTFFNIDLDDFYSRHQKLNSLLTLALKPMDNFDRYGNVIIGDNCEIQSFEEKQYCPHGQISGGVYILDKVTPFFDVLPEKFSFETQVLQSNSGKGCLYGVCYDGYFKDIGIESDYNQAIEDFKTMFK